MATTYGKAELIGGSTSALDNLDGAILSEGDRAIVVTSSNNVYFYRLDEDSGLAESSPDVIAPDNNAGLKRWIRSSFVGMLESIVEDTSPQLGGDLDLNGHGIKFASPATITDCLDEDDMASDSNTKLATQQSIKAYADTKMGDLVDDTSPQLGGVLDINEKGIEYDFASLASNDTYSGDVITATAGKTLATANVCYLKSDGKFWEADADAEATAKGMLALNVGTLSTDTSGIFLIQGLYRHDAWSFATGGTLFISTTAGAFSATAATASGDIVRVAGYAKASNYIWFDPGKTYVEVA